MHQRFLETLEDNVDFVLSHSADDAETKGRMIDELFDLVGILDAVPSRLGRVFSGNQLFERNYHSFMCRARGRDSPGASGCGTEGVISATGIASNAGNFRPDHRQHGVSQQQFAPGAERIHLTADSVIHLFHPERNWSET
jgi:hypothetical protein